MRARQHGCPRDYLSGRGRRQKGGKIAKPDERHVVVVAVARGHNRRDGHGDTAATGRPSTDHGEFANTMRITPS